MCSEERAGRAIGLVLACLVVQVLGPSLLAKPARAQTAPADRSEALADGEVTIAFVGDVLLAGSVGDAIAREGVHYPWALTRELFERADFVVANLETSVAHGGTPENKQFTFRAQPRTLEGLSAAGVDLVTLANNHSLDYGREALLETLEHLDGRGVLRVGAGADAAEAYAPAIVEFGDLRIGFIGVSRVYPYASWPATTGRAGVASGYDYALDAVTAAVDAALPGVDALFVLVHWGSELADEPRQIDLDFARLLLERGVSGVIGHHPHVLQGFRFSPDSGLVAWSLGNFVFRSFRDETRMTAVLFADVDADGRIVAARVEPMYIDDLRPRPAGAQSDAVLRRIRRLSAPFDTSVADDGTLYDPALLPGPVKVPILRIP